MDEPIRTRAVYRQSGLVPPETSEMTEAVRAMRRAPRAQREEFWHAIREAIQEQVEEDTPRVFPMTRPKRESVVYYLRFADRVKIGFTTNLEERLRAIPHDEVLVTESGTIHDEHARHREFADLRVIGEWFRYEQPLIDHIEELRRS